MSPIIEIQRRLVEAGRIRPGEKGPKGEPRKLVDWRLTSKDRQRLEEAAKLWGGEVREWAERQGEFELYTRTPVLPIMLIPGQSPSTWYELWSKGGCQRRCDGQHEIISDSACLCGEERECKPHTRLSVLLPDVPGVGSWLLSSTGWNAAAELAGAADLLQRISAKGELVPARLRLEQRVQVTGGQTRRFAVPVIDIDVSFRELLGAQGILASPPSRAALPAGYVPITSNGGDGASLEQGLAATENQIATRTARSAAPIPSIDDDIPFGAEPVPVEDPGASLGTDAAPTAASPFPAEPQDDPKPGNQYANRDKPLTKAQATKLNVLVGRLREAGHITTDNLWAALATARKIEVELMISTLRGDEDGTLHWSPLRDSLTRDEASGLIDRLERLEAKVGVDV